MALSNVSESAPRGTGERDAGESEWRCTTTEERLLANRRPGHDRNDRTLRGDHAMSDRDRPGDWSLGKRTAVGTDCCHSRSERRDGTRALI